MSLCFCVKTLHRDVEKSYPHYSTPYGFARAQTSDPSSMSQDISPRFPTLGITLLLLNLSAVHIPC